VKVCAQSAQLESQARKARQQARYVLLFAPLVSGRQLVLFLAQVVPQERRQISKKNKRLKPRASLVGMEPMQRRDKLRALRVV
jgi:hypothetical protein